MEKKAWQQPTIEKISLDEIKTRAILTNLTLEMRGTLSSGMVPVPLGSLVSQVHYLQTVVLPPAFKKFGAGSEQFKFYKGLIDTILWAVVLSERCEFFRDENNRLKLAQEFYQAEATRYRNELMKYHLIEDGLLNGQGFEQSMSKARERLAAMIPKPPAAD